MTADNSSRKHKKKKLKGNGSQSRTLHAVFVSSNNPVPVWSGVMCSRSVRRIINTHQIQMRDLRHDGKRKKTEQFSKILTKEAQRDWKHWAWNCFPPSRNAFIFIHQEEEKHQSIYQHLKSIVGNIYVDCLRFGFVTSAYMAGRNTWIQMYKCKGWCTGMDLCGGLCVLKVIYHTPYPACQICWTGCLLFSNAAEGVFMLRNAKTDWIRRFGLDSLCKCSCQSVVSGLHGLEI